MVKRRQAMIACVAIMLLLGLYYTWSVFSNELISSYSWTYSEANLPYTLSIFSYAVAIFLFGFFYQKQGPRKTIILACSLMFIGLLGSGVLFSKKAVAVCYGILYGGGTAGCYTAAISTLLKWAPDKKRSLFSGIATGAYGIAGVYTAFISNALVQRGGVDFCFKIFAFSIIPMLVAASCFLSLPDHCNDKQSINDLENVKSIPLKLALKEKALYLVVVFYIFGCAGGNVIIGNISNISVKQCGLDDGFAFVSLMSLCNCLGRIAGGILGGMFPKKKVLTIALIIDTISLLLFRFYNSIPLMIIGIFIAGFAFGCEMCLIPPILTDYFGIEYYSEIYGAVIFTSCISCFIGPQLAGKLIDISGNFNSTYILCAFYLAISSVAALMLPKKIQE